MKTGIVILNYNDKDSVVCLTDSIAGYDAIDDIVIVDNCSTDDSYEFLRQKYADQAKITVLKSEKNGGYSYGNNFGAKYLINNKKTDIIIISNPDVLFKEDLVIRIKQGFIKNPDYGVLTGVMTKPDGSVDPIPYRNFFSYLHDLGDNLLFVRRLVYEKRVFPVDYSKELMDVQVVQGSFFAITSKAFCDIDGLDDNIFLYYEEMILGKRLLNKGYKSGLLTNQSFIHNHSVSIRKSMKKIKMWRAMLKSKYYYQKRYNNANVLQMGLLHFMGGFSTLEKIVIEIIRLL